MCVCECVWTAHAQYISETNWVSQRNTYIGYPNETPILGIPTKHLYTTKHIYTPLSETPLHNETHIHTTFPNAHTQHLVKFPNNHIQRNTHAQRNTYTQQISETPIHNTFQNARTQHLVKFPKLPYTTLCETPIHNTLWNFRNNHTQPVLYLYTTFHVRGPFFDYLSSWPNDIIQKFAEYRLFHRSLLQKRPIILRSAGPSLIIYPLDTMPLHKNLHKFLCVRYHKNLFMGWLQLVGSLKLQVYFAEYRLFYRSLLQKRPIILRSAGSSLIIYPLDTIDIIQKFTQNFVCKISQKNLYGVATISRLLKIRSLFCRIPSLL